MQNEFKRDSFVLYRSFIDIIKELDDTEAKAFILAISNYALDGIEPQLQGMLNSLWILAKPQLDANIRRYENGKKGGAPKGSSNNPNGRRGKTTNPEITENIATANAEPHRLEPINPVSPTLEQIQRYVSTHNLQIDPEWFFNYYESRGWKSGNTDIVNWEALIRTWVNRAKSQNNPSSGLGTGEYFDSEGNRKYGSGETIVPKSAPPRPSAKHWWNELTNQWESLI